MIIENKNNSKNLLNYLINELKNMTIDSFNIRVIDKITNILSIEKSENVFNFIVPSKLFINYKNIKYSFIYPLFSTGKQLKKYINIKMSKQLKINLDMKYKLYFKNKNKNDTYNTGDIIFDGSIYRLINYSDELYKQNITDKTEFFLFSR